MVAEGRVGGQREVMVVSTSHHILPVRICELNARLKRAVYGYIHHLLHHHVAQRDCYWQLSQVPSTNNQRVAKSTTQKENAAD